MQIWDTAGQQKFKTITHSYYKDSTGVILVYSITSKKSLQSIATQNEQLDSIISDKVSKILIGKMEDLTDDREVSKEEAWQFVAKHRMLFLQVSAKTGKNVERTFTFLARDIKSQRAAIKKEEKSVNVQISI